MTCSYTHRVTTTCAALGEVRSGHTPKYGARASLGHNGAMKQRCDTKAEALGGFVLSP